jgi:medium-chain acyl-[acyl-carrier-protein] hydrolase
MRHLFLGACSAPGQARYRQRLQELDDDAFVVVLRDLGGTRAEVRDNTDLMRLVIPTLRADFTLVEHYRAVERCPLETAITSFAGSEDLDVPVGSIAVWSQVTRGPFDLHIVEGDHFFPKHPAPFTAQIIASRLHGFSSKRNR